MISSQLAISLHLLAAVLLANWPFFSKRFLLVLQSKQTAPWLLVLEIVLSYAAFVLLGRLLEQKLGQIAPQGWQFYAVTICLFITLAFPGFVWRHLLKK